jgi:hypothetical protein
LGQQTRLFAAHAPSVVELDPALEDVEEVLLDSRVVVIPDRARLIV